MFYRPGLDDHGLPHNPFKAIVSPRPIGWIGSLDAEGNANLAPYSFFNALADAPPLVMFSNNGTKPEGEAKDSVTNIRTRGEFTVSIVSRALVDGMNISAGFYKAGEDEFALASLEKGAPRVNSTPFVAAAPAAFECTLWQVIDLPGEHNTLVIGEVVGVHLDPAVITDDGMFDVQRYEPVARLGYRDYSSVTDVFSLKRPGE
ncbi:MAG: flavin reductase family protein [Pseudomonadota bacterium]